MYSRMVYRTLIVMCQHVRGTFDNAVVDFRSKVPAQQMDIDSK